MPADLHLHSTYSDSSVTVAELSEDALSKGINTLSITDHDTFDGSQEKERILGDMGITNILGCEFSCFDKKRGNKVHLLVYLPESIEPFESFIKSIKNSRFSSGEIMAQRLSKHFSIPMSEMDDYRSLGGILYKPNLMHMLKDRGLADAIYGDVYKRVLGEPLGIMFEPITYSDVHDVIEAADMAGGIKVLAHPGLYDGAALMEELASGGHIDGIEKRHVMNSVVVKDKAQALIDRFSLLTTGGSDYHGIYESQRRFISSNLTTDEEVTALVKLKNSRR